MLLNGEPGVGKTLTAESVAEEMRQPLYMMSASELRETAAEVEESLEQVLELTSKWNAILLLDECDMFLEARRNRLVSAFSLIPVSIHKSHLQRLERIEHLACRSSLIACRVSLREMLVPAATLPREDKKDYVSLNSTSSPCSSLQSLVASMRYTLACISLVLLNAAIVRMAPATPGTSTDSGTSFIRLSNMTLGFPDAAPSLSDSFCPRSNNLNSGIKTYKFAVPGTTTILTIFYCPDIPIERELLRQTIVTARLHMSGQLAAYGDGPLLPADDPYNTPVVEGETCTLSIDSQRVPHTQIIPNHLTYQIALNALQGLFGFLYTDNHPGSAVSEISDPGLTGNFKRIGLVGISPML